MVPTQPPWPTYRFDGWTYNRARRELTNPEAVKIPLTSAEHEMMEIFLDNPRVSLSRDLLYEQTGRRQLASICTPEQMRRVDVTITRLRQKIEANTRCPDMIKTVRYVGYYFTPKPEIEFSA